MSKLSRFRSTAVVLPLCLWVPLTSWALHGDMPGVIAIDADKAKFGAAPPVLAKGAKLAVLSGDPGKAGPFVMRLSMPANYRIAPHSHTNTENVTVISGSLQVAMGDKFDMKALHTIKAGGYGSIPGKTNHFAYVKTPTVVQIHGEGPFDLIYANPVDDPQKNMAAKQP